MANPCKRKTVYLCCMVLWLTHMGKGARTVLPQAGMVGGNNAADPPFPWSFTFLGSITQSPWFRRVAVRVRKWG